MKVILKEHVENLGRMGDLIEVSNGYARNYLIPKKLAVAATRGNVTILEHEKRLISERQRKERAAAEELSTKIRELTITIPVQTAEEQSEPGAKIFGSVTNKDIVEALAKEGVTVEKRHVILEKPLRELGSFRVPVKLHPEVTVEIGISVVKA